MNNPRKNAFKLNLSNILFIYAILVILVFLVELLERAYFGLLPFPPILIFTTEVLRKLYPGALPFPFMFWDALTAVGTAGAVFVALVVPIIIKWQEKEEVVRQTISNILKEVFMNFELLSYNGLNRRDFTLAVTQLELLQKSMYLLNLEAEGLYRKLYLFYNSAKWFNERMENFVKEHNFWIEEEKSEKAKAKTEKEKRETWISIKRDVIKLMLVIFWLGGLMDFEKEGEDYIDMINKFIGIENIGDKAYTEMRENFKNTPFWKMKNFTEIVKPLSVKPIDFEELQEQLTNNEVLDLISKKEIVLDFLIHRLYQIYNQKKSR